MRARRDHRGSDRLSGHRGPQRREHAARPRHRRRPRRPDRTDVPFTLTVDGNLVSTATDGTFQTTLTPTSPGQPLDVKLEAEATNPSLQNTAFSDLEDLVKPTRERLLLRAQGPTAIPLGGSVSLSILVAGDGMAGSNVALRRWARLAQLELRHHEQPGRGGRPLHRREFRPPAAKCHRHRKAARRDHRDPPDHDPTGRDHGQHHDERNASRR